MTFAQLGKPSAFGQGLPKIESVDDTLSSGLIKAVAGITIGLRDALCEALNASGPYPLTATIILQYVSDDLEELTLGLAVTATGDDSRDSGERVIFLVEITSPDNPLEVVKRRHGLRDGVWSVYGDDFGLIDVTQDGTLQYVLEEDDFRTRPCSCSCQPAP